MPYEFLEEVATADIAFKAWGKDLETTFISAADALMNAMVEELDAIEPQEERILQAENEALDMLLFDFLQEFIYYKDAEMRLQRTRQVRIEEKGEQGYMLRAVAHGEEIDLQRHHMRVDVKAVTLHRFRLEQTESGWQAFVILDI